jgi:asparagine synthase (glutamine-hydrolysing)
MVSEVMQYGFINAPNSAFNEIKQIPPASVLTWRDGKTSIVKYWVPNFDTKVKATYQDALETTKELIETAVSRCLISERPLGSFLSGGYDSTVITAYKAKLMKEKVQTYSIGFRDSEYDESQWAAKVAAHIGTDHHQEIVEPDPALILSEISNVSEIVEYLVNMNRYKPFHGMTKPKKYLYRDCLLKEHVPKIHYEEIIELNLD